MVKESLRALKKVILLALSVITVRICIMTTNIISTILVVTKSVGILFLLLNLML